jgi:hypothetical protein
LIPIGPAGWGDHLSLYRAGGVKSGDAAVNAGQLIQRPGLHDSGLSSRQIDLFLFFLQTFV